MVSETALLRDAGARARDNAPHIAEAPASARVSESAGQAGGFTGSEWRQAYEASASRIRALQRCGDVTEARASNCTVLHVAGVLVSHSIFQRILVWFGRLCRSAESLMRPARTYRSSQLDAARLDDELGQMMKEQFMRIFSMFQPVRGLIVRGANAKEC